jgi:hypothetical protein
MPEVYHRRSRPPKPPGARQQRDRRASHAHRRRPDRGQLVELAGQDVPGAGEIDEGDTTGAGWRSGSLLDAGTGILSAVVGCDHRH